MVSYPESKTFWDFDIHLVPINHDNLHWSLCVIDREQYLIYHIDSIRSEYRDRTVTENMMIYVSCEYEKRNPIGDLSQFKKKWSMKLPAHLNVWSIPQQLTSSGDCGIFVLLFADNIAYRNKCTGFTQTSISQDDMRMQLCKLMITFNDDVITRSEKALSTKQHLPTISPMDTTTIVSLMEFI